MVNLAKLDKKFKDGETVSPKILLEKKMIGKIKRGVKILGVGEMSKKLVIESCSVSKTAREKIEKAGGEIIKGN